MRKKQPKSIPPGPKVPKWAEDRPEREKAMAINARLAFRALRRAVGLNQPEFAQKLGVSLAAVQGAESGYRPVSRDMARLIQTRFGVFASSVTGFTREPLTLLGERVTQESVARVISEQPHALDAAEMEQFVAPLRALIDAASRVGRLRVLGAAYKDALRELKEAVDLDAPLSAVLGARSPRPAKRKITRKQLRESPELAQALEHLGITDDPSRPEDEYVEVTASIGREVRPWIPASSWIPNWNDFVAADGQVQWAVRGSDGQEES